MARPARNNVDYFPFYCEEGKKMYYLEETYGNDGFATFVKILRELAKTNYHYLDLSGKTTRMFLSAKCKISTELLENIIEDLVELEKFDKDLWTENQIIWCQDFVDSIEDAYSKRKNKCINYEGLLQHLNSLGIRKPSKSKSIGGINPKSRVEYNKVDKTKEKNTSSEIENFKASTDDKNEILKYILKKYDQHRGNLPRVRVFSEKRKKAMKARIKEHGLDVVEDMLKLVYSSSFLQGDNRENWTADFDWIFNKSNFIKIIEGNYQNKSNGKQKSGDQENRIGRQSYDVIRENSKGWATPE